MANGIFLAGFLYRDLSCYNGYGASTYEIIQSTLGRPIWVDRGRLMPATADRYINGKIAVRKFYLAPQIRFM